MFWILLILALVDTSFSLPFDAQRQRIFDTVFTSMTRFSGCVDNSAFLKAFNQALVDEKIIPEIFRQERAELYNSLKRYNYQRKWSSLNHYQHQICIVSEQQAKQYLPSYNFTTPKLSVKDIVAQYPYFKRSMDHKSITKLLMALPPFIRQLYQLRRFTIIDHKLYVQSFESNPNPNHYGKYITPHLDKLPDMDFIMTGKFQLNLRDMYDHIQSQTRTFQQYIGKLELYKRIINQLPIFLIHKNLLNDLQFNKFLLPGTQSLDGDWWSGMVRQVDEGVKLYKWEDKINKAYYRSGVSGLTNGEDGLQNNVPVYFTRLHLVNISRSNQELVQAQFSGNQTFWNGAIQKIDFKFNPEIVQQLSWKDMQKYKYLISMDGWTASTRKVPLVLRSGSVLFKQMGQKVQWYFDKLIPNQHYVSLKRTVDDVLDKVKEMRENDGLAKSIMENGNRFFKEYLSTEGTNKHFVEILVQYASIQQLELDSIQRMLYVQKNMYLMQDRRNIYLSYYTNLYSGICILVLCLVSILLILISPVSKYIQNYHKKASKYSSFFNVGSHLKDTSLA